VNIKTTLKSSVAVAALFAVAAPVANAADDTFKTGNKNSLTMSGRVSTAIFRADDGTSGQVFITDGAISASRLRWIAKGTVNANVTAGVTYEVDVPTANEPGSVTLGGTGLLAAPIDGTELSPNANWGLRHSYVWVNHKKMGKLSLGQTSVASDATGEANLSGGGFYGASMLGAYGGAIEFVETTNAAPSASGKTIANVFSNYDAGGREETLRYDLPSFMGISAKIGYINGGNWDVGLQYSGKIGPMQLLARAGYNDRSATSATANYNAAASVAVLHDSGLNVAYNIGKVSTKSEGMSSQAAGAQANALQATIEDPQTTYWSIGYKAKIFGAGGTNFEVSYANTQDEVVSAGFDDTDATMWGVSGTQNFDAIGAQVAIQYQNYELDANNAGTAMQFDDIDVITLQTIFNF